MQRFGFLAGILYGGMPYDKNRPLYLEACGFAVRAAGFGSDMEAEHGFLRIYTEAMRAFAVRRRSDGAEMRRGIHIKRGFDCGRYRAGRRRMYRAC